MTEKGALPSVSVLMNCFNGAAYIGAAIESVLAQSWTDFELVVWDNCSSDDSAAIVQSYQDSRIRLIPAPAHTTLAEARRQAFEHLRGQWIGILDVDDLWRESKLEKQMAIANSGNDDDLGFIYCRTNVLSSAPASNYLFDSTEAVLPTGRIYRRLLRGNFICIASLLINRRHLQSIGGFSGNYPIMEDYYVTLNISRSYLVQAIDEVLCDYRLHGNNASNRGPLDTFEDLRIVRQLFPDPAASIAALRIIARHFKKCLVHQKMPQLADLTRALLLSPT